MKVTINIPEDFYPEAISLFRRIGKHSGEEFRERVLIPALKKHSVVVVELDDSASYGSSFLEEAFGGAVRKGHPLTNECLELKAKNRLLVSEVWDYIHDAMKQCKSNGGRLATQADVTALETDIARLEGKMETNNARMETKLNIGLVILVAIFAALIMLMQSHDAHAMTIGGKMIPYQDIDRDSGVSAYSYGEDYIIVEFKGGSRYEYTYQSAGAGHIERMKELADYGDGLNAYINRYVRKRYSKKIR